MKVKAMRTMKNAYDQVLFTEGKEYKVVDADSKRYWVLNELHMETPIRISRLTDNFMEVNND